MLRVKAKKVEKKVDKSSIPSGTARKQRVAKKKRVASQVTRAQAHDHLRALTSQGYSFDHAKTLAFLESRGRVAHFCYSLPCHHQNTESDIRQGFTNNNVDFTTVCGVCGKRGVAMGLMRGLSGARFEVVGALSRFPLLCPDQTRDQVAYYLESQNLTNLSDTNKVIQLALNRPALAWNAYWHGRTTVGEEDDRVQDVIQFFLFGTLPADPFAAAQDFIAVETIPLELPDEGENDMQEDDDVILYGEEDEPILSHPKALNSEEQVAEDVEEPDVMKRPEPDVVEPRVRPAFIAPPRPVVGKAAVKRTAQKHGVYRIAKHGTSRVQNLVDAFADDLIADSTLVMRHRRAKTLKEEDVDLVTKIWRNHGARGGYF
jgi:histone H3/H4